MKQCIFFIFIQAGVGWACSSTDPEELTGHGGKIYYMGRNTAENCEWKISPHLTHNNYAMVIYLSQLSMTYEENDVMYCSGTIYLPENPGVCGRSLPYCHVYSIPGSLCDFNEVKSRSFFSFPECNETRWYLVENFPTNIRLESNDAHTKTISLRFDFLHCPQLFTGKTETVPASQQPIHVCIQYIVAVVILAILLTTTSAALVICYLRQKCSPTAGVADDVLHKDEDQNDQLAEV